jgi:sulfoxide reductase heme-binding subunit YedZ
MVLSRPAAPSGHGRPRSFDRIGRVVKPVVFTACLLPLAWLAGEAATGGLGANPIEATNRFLGDWALRFLLISLAVRPLRDVLSWPAVIRFRRMLGLFAFFYAVLHVTSYVGLDQFFHWGEIWADIRKRAFITVGLATLLLLTPLAMTSTKGMVKRLGAGRWQRLHTLVYPAAILATLHFFMMVKADVREPLAYAAILACLLGYRLVIRLPRTAAVRSRIAVGKS